MLFNLLYRNEAALISLKYSDYFPIVHPTSHIVHHYVALLRVSSKRLHAFIYAHSPSHYRVEPSGGQYPFHKWKPVYNARHPDENSVLYYSADNSFSSILRLQNRNYRRPDPLKHTGMNIIRSYRCDPYTGSFLLHFQAKRIRPS